MTLDRIRRVVLPGGRSVRSTFVSLVLMLGLAAGLIAMHDAGAEHAAHAAHVSPVATAPGSVSVAPDHADAGHAGYSGHDASAGALLSSATAVVAGTVVALALPDPHGALDGLAACAAAVAGCAMLAAVAAAVALAVRPGRLTRHPMAAPALPRGIRLRIGPPPPPDLHLLSISRT